MKEGFSKNNFPPFFYLLFFCNSVIKIDESLFNIFPLLKIDIDIYTLFGFKVILHFESIFIFREIIAICDRYFSPFFGGL